MITSVAGTTQAIAADSVVISVGGFGVRLLCPAAVASQVRVGQPVELAATLVVREDSLTLYGFADDDQRDVFELLQSVSGFGPKIALAVLSTFGCDELRAAVAASDERALTTIPGIGRKGAQRLLLELGDKLGPPRFVRDSQTGGPAGAASDSAVDVREFGVGPGSSTPDWRVPVRAALIGLGWSAREAEAAVAAVVAGAPDSADSPDPVATAPPVTSPASPPATARDVIGSKLKLALRALDRS